MNRRYLLLLPLATLLFPPQSSASIGSSYLEEDAQMPAPPARTTFVARPDLLRIPVILTVREPEPSRAVEPLRVASDDLAKRLATASGGQAKLRLRGYGRPVSSGKELQRTASLDAMVEVALPATADFWSRAKLVAAVESQLADATAKGIGPKGAVAVERSEPEAVLANPEAQRAELLKRWNEAVQALIAGVQDAKTPLAVVECEPAGPVQQEPVSLEEVGVTLTVDCRIGRVDKR